MTEGIISSSRFATKGLMNGKQHRVKKEQETYIKLYNYLKQYNYKIFRANYIPKNSLKIRSEKMLHFIENYVKLDKIKINHLSLNFCIDDYRTGGKFKNKTLL